MLNCRISVPSAVSSGTIILVDPSMKLGELSLKSSTLTDRVILDTRGGMAVSRAETTKVYGVTVASSIPWFVMTPVLGSMNVSPDMTSLYM